MIWGRVRKLGTGGEWSALGSRDIDGQTREGEKTGAIESSRREGGLEVFNDLGGDDIGRSEVGGVFEAFVF